MSKEFIKTIQRRLSALGLYDGLVDGLAGGKTEKGFTALIESYLRHEAVPDRVTTGTVGGSATRLLPPEWLPKCDMDRVIVHWTAGSYTASSLDKEHYHVILEGSGKAVRGLHPITANVNTKDGDYAAHTLNCNTKSVGVSMCCMAGAVEKPFKAGNFPMTEAQWNAMTTAVAEICKAYGIPVTDKTVLSHAEVQTNLGIAQRGKWDFTRLAFAPSVVGAKACGDKMREEVRAKLAQI